MQIKIETARRILFDELPFHEANKVFESFPKFKSVSTQRVRKMVTMMAGGRPTNSIVQKMIAAEHASTKVLCTQIDGDGKMRLSKSERRKA